VSAIWKAVNSSEIIQPIASRACRLVETQEEAATLALVDSFTEQDLLERLLETAKPPLPQEVEGLHYLLATPFRYPPLPYGSRFGRRHEPGILYASLTAETCLAEVAYYRLVYINDLDELPPNPVTTQHMLFWLKAHHNRGVNLTDKPFRRFLDALTHPSDYAQTQALGSALREEDVAVVRYVSARCPESGQNLAVFTPGAIRSKVPENEVAISCETRKDHVFLYGETRADFSIDSYLKEGRFPLPA